MIGDISAINALRAHRVHITNLICDLESGLIVQSKDIKLDLLLTARDCLASARTEEHYLSEQDATTELPSQE